jgi:hypothetical protein
MNIPQRKNRHLGFKIDFYYLVDTMESAHEDQARGTAMCGSATRSRPLLGICNTTR